MANLIVDQNWIKYERATVLAPKALVKELRQVLNGEMKAVKQALLANVSGTILKKNTGRLAKTISARVRLFNGGSKVWSRAGSKYYVGRFWEGGFARKGKNYPARKWASPVVLPATQRINTIMQQTIQKTLDQGGL